MTMVDYQSSYNLPHRKPAPPMPSIVKRNDLRSLDMNHQAQMNYTSTSAAPPPLTTTVSTTTYQAFPPRLSSHAPANTINTNLGPAPQSSYNNNPMHSSRRTLSQSTTSSTTYAPSRTPSNVSSQISRNSSTRSGASSSPGSYVALMRKQKATVWCDRAQHEDPRLVAQQKAAKVRAAREITAGAMDAGGRNSTSGSMGSGSLGVRSKIRHHGAPKVSGYSTANMVGGRVPMRLSANEVGDEGTYNAASTTSTQQQQQQQQQHHHHHHRSSSARSRDSKTQALYPDTQLPPINGQASSTINGVHGNATDKHVSGPQEPAVGATSGPLDADYFSTPGGQGGSGGSSEREQSFGNISGMEAPKSRVNEGKSEDELRRRGSVDERANTMGFIGGGRLFVANPDLSD